MKIENKKVVEIEYEIKSGTGELIDSSKDHEENLTYIHGIGNLIPGLENALTGMGVGEEKKVSIKAADAFGKREDDLIQTAKRSDFPEDTELKVGEAFYTYDNKGQAISFTIKSINGEDITIDYNHPLAGIDIEAWVKVVDIRDATEEEIAHGHVHGEEGHEHHH